MKKIIKYSKYIPGLTKMCCLKILHYNQLYFSYKSYYPPSLKIKFKSKKAKLIIGKSFNARENITFRVGGELIIGNNVFINANSRIECENEITIGNDVLFGPNVYIYDHDHAVIKGTNYNKSKLKLGKVKIGNNIWVGMSTIILTGTVIKDDSVIGAGTLIRQEVSKGKILYQKRDNRYKEIT